MKVSHTPINVGCLIPKCGRCLSWRQLREINFVIVKGVVLVKGTIF